MYAPAEEKHPEQRTFSMALYIIVGFCGIMQYFMSTVLFGTILLLICFFMVRAQKATAQNTIYITHVEWTRRTLSIGTFYLFPIALAFACYFISKTIDFAAIRQQLDGTDGEIGGTITLMKGYITENAERVEHISTLCITPVILWWLRRCVYGFMKAKSSEPIFYPQGLL